MISALYPLFFVIPDRHNYPPGQQTLCCCCCLQSHSPSSVQHVLSHTLKWLKSVKKPINNHSVILTVRCQQLALSLCVCRQAGSLSISSVELTLQQQQQQLRPEEPRRTKNPKTERILDELKSKGSTFNNSKTVLKHQITNTLQTCYRLKLS